MSWRETLGVANRTDDVYAHNPHNTQKPAEADHSADIANSASRHSDESDPRLLETLADACRGLPITLVEVREALAPEDRRLAPRQDRQHFVHLRPGTDKTRVEIRPARPTRTSVQGSAGRK